MAIKVRDSVSAIVPLYNVRVYFVFSEEAYHRILLKLTHGDRDMPYCVGGCCEVIESPETGEQRFVIAEFCGSVPNLAHECFHCAHKLLEYIGINIDGTDGEACAYVISFLMDKACGGLKNYVQDLNKQQEEEDGGEGTVEL